MPEGDNKNAVAQSLVMNSWQQDPDSAPEMLDDLPAEYAESLRQNIAYQWLARKPDDVEIIIRELKLTSDQANAIRRQPRSQVTISTSVR